MINEYENDLFRDLTKPSIVRQACFYGGAGGGGKFYSSSSGPFSTASKSDDTNLVHKTIPKNLNYKNWLKDLKNKGVIENKDVIKGLEYVLSKLHNFKGKMAIVGSSVEEKYPLGTDLDLALIGYGKKDALQFLNNFYKSLEKEKRETSNSIFNHKEINCPAIPYTNMVEDPFLVVARKEEIIPKHGGIDFELGVLCKRISMSPKQLLIDIIADVSYRDEGIEENFIDWKEQMKKAGRNYLILNN